MIIPIGTALNCRFSDGANAEGLTTASRDGVVEARFGDAGAIKKGSCAEIRFVHDEDGRAWVVGACVERAGSAGDVVFALSGEASPENQRAAYRVVTACADVSADVGRQRDRRVLDVSEGGFSTELVDAPHAGTVFEVTLRAFGRTARGRFVLRHARPLHLSPQGEVCRCGLQVAAGQPELVRQMREVVMEAQRAQLRNRSRLTGRSGPAMSAASQDAVSDEHAEAAGAPDDAPDGAPEIGDPQPASPARAEDGPGSEPSPDRLPDAGPDCAREAGPARAEGDTPGCAKVRLSLQNLMGRPMPFSLRDARGRIVVARGETIDAGAAARIASSELEICEDWFAPDPKAEGSERRVCERRSCHADIRVWLVGADGARSVDGEMVDISRGGAGVRTRGVAHQGSLVIVEFRGQARTGWIVARVQSSTVAPDSAYCRLGLRFLQSGVQHTPTPAPNEMRQVIQPFAATDRQRRVQPA